MTVKCNFNKFFTPKYIFILLLIALATYVVIDLIIKEKKILEGLNDTSEPVNIYGVGNSSVKNFGSAYVFKSGAKDWQKLGGWVSKIRYKNGKIYAIGVTDLGHQGKVDKPPQRIYAMDADGEYDKGGPMAKFSPVTPSWPHNSFRDLQVANNGYVYVVSGVGRVFRSNGGEWARVTGGKQQISWLGLTPTRYIGIGNGAMGLWSWNRNDGPDGEWKLLDSWANSGKKGKLLDLAVNGEDIYVVAGRNEVYQWNGKGNWKLIAPCCVTSIDIHGDQIYGVGTDNKVYKHSLDGTGTWKQITSVGWVWSIAIATGTPQREPQVGDRGREQRAEYREENPINKDDVSTLINYSILNKQIVVPPLPPAPPKSLDTPEVCQFFDLPITIIKANDRFSKATDAQLNALRLEGKNGCKGYISQALCGQNPFCNWGNAAPAEPDGPTAGAGKGNGATNGADGKEQSDDRDKHRFDHPHKDHHPFFGPLVAALGGDKIPANKK